jgi:catechol 2,3-dioxygenase-like lactoylglutathione lyase family enzyme
LGPNDDAEFCAKAAKGATASIMSIDSRTAVPYKLRRNRKKPTVMEEIMAGTFTRTLGAITIGLTALLGTARADVGPNPKLDADGAMFVNVSISVADLDKSAKFYQALGFQAGDTHALPTAVANLLGAKGADAKLDIKFLTRDGVVLELIHFTPAASMKASPGAASQLGLAHIAFRVEDVDRFAKLVKENGGATMDAGRTKLGPIDILFATDPDGTHIEIAGPAKK